MERVVQLDREWEEREKEKNSKSRTRWRAEVAIRGEFRGREKKKEENLVGECSPMVYAD